MVKKSIKYLSVTVVTIFIIIIALMLLIQTPWFAHLTRKQTVRYINSSFNANISIGQITGNWFSHLEIKNINLRQKHDSLPIAGIESLELKYNLRSLLKKKIAVQSVHINSPRIWLRQDDNGEWAITRIIPESEDSLQTSPGTFPFDLSIDTIGMSNAGIYIQSNIELIPDSINNLSFNASVFYNDRSFKANLHNFELHSFGPDLSVQNIKAGVQKNGEQLKLDSLLIQINNSVIKGTANYESLSNNKSQLEATPLNNKLVTIFIPSIKLPHSPTITTDFTTRADTSNISVKLAIANEKVNIDMCLLQPEKFICDKAGNLPFSTNITFKEVRPENWWDISPTQSIVNGRITLSGLNLLNTKHWDTINGELSGSSYNNHIFNTLSINTIQSANTLSTSINIESEIGNLKSNIEFRKLYSSPTCNGHLSIDKLLLDELITPGAGYINGQLSLKGNVFAKDSLKFNCKLQIADSYIYSIPVDSVVFCTQLNNNLLKWDNSAIYLPGGNIHTAGLYHLNTTQLSSNTTYAFDSLSFLHQYELPPVEFTNAKGEISLTGTLDSLQSKGCIALNRFNGFSVSSEHVNSDFNANYHNKQLKADANLALFNLQNDELTIDSVKSHLSYKQDLLNTRVVTYMDSVTADVSAGVSLTDTIKINLAHLNINTPFANYHLADSSGSICLYNNDININNLSVRDKRAPSFGIDANGTISNHTSEFFELNINNFNLTTFKHFKLINNNLNGLFSTHITLTGFPESPILHSGFSLSPGSFGNIQTPELEGHIKIKDQIIESNIYIPHQQNKLNLNYSSPVIFKLDSSGFVFEPGNTFEALLAVDSLSLADPAANIQAGGQLFANITASGSYNQPLFFGFAKLVNGKYKYDKYGIDIQKADITLQFDSNQVNIDTFLIKRDKGYLTMTGTASFDSSMITGNIHSSTLEAKAKDFHIIKHHNYSALIDANSFYKTINDSAKFGGKITVLSSDFYLPAFIKDDDNDQINEPPLLIKAITPLDTARNNKKIIIEKEEKDSGSEFIKNLQGRLKLEIPRNTWLRSEEMKLEIWGDLEIEKSNDYFELYGDVGIRRGYYLLYGKKLVIDEGELTFQGGEQIDPALDFKATYTYRGSDKEKRKLNLQVGGKLSEPSISFTLDEVVIPEADAISILILGKTMDELSFSDQKGISGSIGTNILAKAVTSQLSKTLGTHFNLDLIEISSTENWQSAAFVVGKYVTNDLFVVYQRGFGEAEGDEITPEMIILEYELNRILFFRLQSSSSKDSGFDVILKFEPKKD